MTLSVEAVHDMQNDVPVISEEVMLVGDVGFSVSVTFPNVSSARGPPHI